MFTTRLLTVVIALPIFLAGLLLLPQPLWALVLLPIVAIAAWEWAGLASCSRAVRIGYAALAVLSALAIFFLVPQTAETAVGISIYALSAGFWLVVAPLWLKKGWKTRNPLVLAVAGWIALVPMWLALVQLQPDPWALLLFLSIVWIADTAAYVAGKRWGRRKLAPRISPGKTWEGALGAALAVGLFYLAILVGVPAVARYLEWPYGALIVAAIFALSVIGDLFESWMKRTAGVKDSGQLLPGHGGILDRIDGLTATMPVAALALSLYMADKT
jgi:phosphatidate cytidylyltransferase